MCGIAGFALRNPGPNPGSLLEKMTSAIAHRGPDDAGTLVAQADSGNFTIGLGHRRLSIIDLHAGHQPLGNEDGSVQIIFNGEIYNYRSLQRELTARGHTFRTNSDTETIVHAYEEFGADCVHHLNGMFAFAIWDQRSETLFMARDRIGKKPLFVVEGDGELWFGSEIKALLASGRIPADVDLDAVYDYFSYRYVPGPATLIRKVRKLPPGCRATWCNGRFEISRYYAPPDLQTSDDAAVPANPVDEFLDRLDNAVASRMVSDVPFGAFLSGGVDSSAIVALMTRHSELPVKTFSVGFAASQYSELAYAQAIARQFNTDHHELQVAENDLMEELPGLVRFRDAPVSEPSDIPIYLLAKEARKSVKMVLTGEGSDEILGGYPKHVFESYVAKYQLLPRVVRTNLIEPLVRLLPYRFRRAKTAALTMGLEDHTERMVRWFGALSNLERQRLVTLRSSGNNPQADWCRMESAPRSALRRILSFDQTSWLPDNLLERGDRMTMAASVEARMPFLDHELAAFVSALPDRYRVRGRTTKWLLREAMKQLLPTAILERPKIGFRVPVNDWFRGSMKDFLYEHLTSDASMTAHYYHPALLHKLLHEHTSGRQNHEKALWTLLNLEIWHRVTLRGS